MYTKIKCQKCYWKSTSKVKELIENETELKNIEIIKKYW